MDRSLSYRRFRPLNPTLRHTNKKTRPHPSAPQRKARGSGDGGGSGSVDGGGLGYRQPGRLAGASGEKSKTGKRKEVEVESSIY